MNDGLPLTWPVTTVVCLLRMMFFLSIRATSISVVQLGNNVTIAKSNDNMWSTLMINFRSISLFGFSLITNSFQCLSHTFSLPLRMYLCIVTHSGLDNAGKTTILKRLNGENIDTIEPTLGFNINTLEHRGYTLNFWDVGGQKSLRSYWRNYFESTDGLVWVVDSADKMRLDNCKAELHNLLQEERLAGATLLVLANKQDVPGALSSKDIKDVCLRKLPHSTRENEK